MAAELAIIVKLQDEASAGIRAVRGEVESLGDSGGIAAKGLQSIQSVGTVALAAVAVAAVAAGAALAGFFVGSVEKAAALEAQMDTVAALLGATADQAELLRQATLDLALDPQLKVSATEAAQAIEMLAQNGLGVEEILGGAARATVLLANATGADFTMAARIATDAMALWGMEADQLGQVADGVTAVLVQSKFGVNDYALALAQAGGVAAAVGVSFQDFNATLVAIAPYFASGSDAGTSYKTMLQHLIPTSNAAKDAMAALGLITEEGANAFFDSQGNMRDMAEVAGILHNALGGLTEQQRLQALSTIFGTDAMRAAAAMSQFTEEQFRNLMAVMADTSAAEIAAQRMQNFSGAMDILKGVIEGLQLMLGNVLLPILTQLALSAANLLAAWGPPIIAVFQNFIDNLSEGMSVIDAFIEAIWDITPQPVLDALVQFRDSILPIIQNVASAITSFVSWKDVLVALGIAIASVVVPAIWAIIQVVAPIIAAFGGLILAIAAVRTAFETNFLGIRDLALTLWSALQGVFDGIKALLQGDTAAAMTAFRSAWETGWNAIVSFIQNAGSQIGQALQGLWQSIVAWFQGVDWGALAQSLIQRFFDGMAALGQAAAGSWQWLLTSITNFIQSVDWAAVGRTLIDLLVSGIVGAIGLIGTAVAGIVTFIWNFITGTNWIELGTNLVSAIIQGLYSFAQGAADALAGWRQVIFDWAGAEDWGGVAEKITTMVGDALGTAKEAISSKLGEWKTAIFDWAGAEDWQGVAEHIAGVVGEKMGEAKDAITAKLGEWQTAIFDWADAEDWQGVAEHVAGLIGEKLGEAGDAISGQLSEWQSAIFDWADAEDWEGVAEHIAGLIGEKLGEAGDAISGQLSEWQSAIFDWADAEDWEGVAEHIAGLIGEKLGEAGDAISSQLGEWQTAIFDWADAEDWQGVAEHIASLVGEKLGEAKDSLTATLSEWQTAIFDWAGAEDWSGVATKIAEMVGDALGSTADSVVSTLDSWEEAIFEWADAADWADVSEAIAGAVGDSLVEVSDKVTEKLSGWITAFTDWVNSVDWYQVGYDIMFKITDAFLDFKLAMITKISTWLSDTKSATEGFAWYEVGAYILLKIVESAAGLVSDWAGSVQAWISNIGAAVSQHLANLAQVGRDLVAGIAAGIAAAGDLIQGAIAGVIGAAEPAARQASQSNSPSRLMMPVGEDLSAGIAVGIVQGAGDIVGAIQQVASAAELEGVKAFGEAMTAIADGIAAALSAALDVGSFSGTGEGFGAALDAIVAMMAAMVTAIAAANTHSAEVLEQLADFVDLAGEINDLLVQTADVTDYIVRWEPPNIEATTAAINTLVGYLSLMVQGIVSLNMEAMLVLGALGDFMEVALQLPELFAGVADVMSFLSSWQAPSLEPAIASLNTLAAFLQQLVTAVASANTMGLGALSILAAFIETVSGIVDLIAPLTDAIKNVVAFPGGGDLYLFVRNIEVIADYMQALVAAVAASNEWGALSLELLDEFVQVAGQIAELITPMTEAIKNVVAFPGGGDLYLFVQNVEAIATYLQAMVAAIAESNQWSSLSLALLDEFVQVAGEIADLISPMTEAIKNIVSFKSPDWSSFLSGVAAIGTYMAYLVGAFNEGLLYSHDALDLLDAYIEVVGALAEQVGVFIEAIGLIGTFVAPPFWDFLSGVAAIGTYMAYLVGAFNEGLLYAHDALDLLDSYVEVVGALAEQVGVFIEAIGLIGSFVPPPFWDFLSGVAAIGTYMAYLVGAFNEGLLYSHDALDLLSEYVNVVGDLVDLVGDAIEALGLIAAYSSNTATLQPAIVAFGADLVLLVSILSTAFAAAAAETLAASAAAADFTEKAGEILDVVEPGIEALTALANYVAASGIQAAVQMFAADLVTLVQTLAAALAAAALQIGTASDVAAEFAEKAEAIVDVVEPGIEALGALADYVSASGVKERTQAFATDLVMVITTLANGLAASGLAANAAVTEAAALSEKLTEVLDVVKPGIEALGALADYTSSADLQAKTQQFTTDIINVTQTLVTGLTQSALATGDALGHAMVMANNISSLFGVIVPALEALEALAAYSAASDVQAKAAQFTADLVAVANTLVTGLNAAATQLGEGAITAAQAFAAAVTGIVQEVGEAISGLIQLSQLPAPNIQPNLDYLIVSAQQIAAAAQQSGVVAQAGEQMAVFRDNVAQLVDEVIAALAELARLVSANAPGSVQDVLNAMLSAFQNQVGAFVGAGATLANNFITGWRSADWAGSGQYAVDQVANGVSSAASTLISAVSALIQAIINQARAFAADFTDVGRQLVEAAAAGMAAASGAVTAAALSAIADAISAATNAASGAGVVGSQFIASVVSGIDGGRNTVIAAVVNMVNDAISAGANAAHSADQVGNEIVNATESGINSGTTAIKAAVEHLVSGAIDAGRNAAKAASAIGQELVNAANDALQQGRSTLDASGSSAGTAMIDGMARAINNGRSKVVNAIIDTVQAAINAAENALGISSPSKVFGRIAAQTIEGFVREFQANSDIANAVSRSMEAAVGAATEELARGSLSVALQPPVTSRATANASLTTRSAEPGAASTFAGRSGTFNLYGNIVLNNVSDARSFLEELDALRGGGQ